MPSERDKLEDDSGRARTKYTGIPSEKDGSDTSKLMDRWKRFFFYQAKKYYKWPWEGRKP